jgi:hypothetical protein
MATQVFGPWGGMLTSENNTTHGNLNRVTTVAEDSALPWQATGKGQQRRTVGTVLRWQHHNGSCVDLNRAVFKKY